ncbi:hypothetical protein CGH87_12935 [Vibrio parahaemolyticus]|nr:hypothetical protein CGH87_12935 [Vibrio parahaemolyticus]
MFSFKRNKESKNNQVLLRCTFRTLSAMNTLWEGRIHIILSFYASPILSSCAQITDVKTNAQLVRGVL